VGKKRGGVDPFPPRQGEERRGGERIDFLFITSADERRNWERVKKKKKKKGEGKQYLGAAEGGEERRRREKNFYSMSGQK